MTHGPPASRKRPAAQNGGGNGVDPEGHHNPQTQTQMEESGLPTPPDGGWGWMVVLASFCIHIVTDGLTYSFGIFYVEFLDYFKEGKGYTAWIASILVGVTLCSGPISSSLVNRYGCRIVTIAGSVLASACLAVSIYAQSVFMLFITIGLGTGLGLGLIYLPAIVSVTMYFERLRSLATGIAVCGSGLGTFIFAPLTEILIKQLGWRGALLVIAVIVLGTSIFGAMFRPLVATEKTVEEGKLTVAEESNGRGVAKVVANGVTDASRVRSQSFGSSPKLALNTNAISSSGHSLNIKPPHSEDQNIREIAVSQPLLSANNSDEQSRGSSSTINAIKRAESGTMYRKDALYTGSVHNLANQNPSYSSLALQDRSRYGSVQMNGVNKSKFDEQETVCCGCIPCSKETSDTFQEMMNFSLLKDPIFIIFTVSNFLTSVGFNIPYVYLAAQAAVLDIDTKQASYLLGIIGIANTVGRIILGYLSDKTWVNRLLVYNLSLTICGLATAFSVMCLDFYSLATYSAVFGFTIGAYVGLTSVILVDLLGLDKLTNAFGLLLLFQGIASFIGPPLAGSLYDITESYKPGFILAGTTIAISGVMLFVIPCMQKRLSQKQKSNEVQLQQQQQQG
ncbi:monocarboxylate transporter 13 [Uranotaenia lowii]|uniref:monocarboxylate transporter 13 n=1 Tax=Uranotaenia lowii TaxID=190385 RepID=UPI002479D2A3|nr:monocarboxylate transporter 13 [Uranotaenia lowii]XP_055585949.1 monocarboxylate transporter 13 [Uranotaenia lowii]XP_055585950.1 monocarboxylate transporter 13 [Uranotaenia lowii]